MERASIIYLADALGKIRLLSSALKKDFEYELNSFKMGNKIRNYDLVDYIDKKTNEINLLIQFELSKFDEQSLKISLVEYQKIKK